MFPCHRPRVYRSSCGCCICGSKSSSSRFVSSEKYEDSFPRCFGVQHGCRTGFMCNACVLLVKRWEKLPEGSKRSWNHVVDGKRKTRRACRLSKTNSKDEKAVEILENPMQRSGLPIAIEGASGNFGEMVLPCSPVPSDGSSDCTIGDNGHTSIGCQTSFLFPLFERNTITFPYIDLTGWRKEEVCCGIIFKGPNGEVLVDPKLLKPHCNCSRQPSESEIEEKEKS